MELLKSLPEPDVLIEKWKPDRTIREVNGHLHSPFSFCPFESIEQMFTMAREEGVRAIGINDFFTVDGYNKFEHFARENMIFPLFNIEFVGLMKGMQEKDIRINDPKNPRILPASSVSCVGVSALCMKYQVIAVLHPSGPNHLQIRSGFLCCHPGVPGSREPLRHQV